MLQPKKAKHRKKFRGRMKGISGRATSLDFGDYGLKAEGRGWLSARQIEAARRAITHYTKRGGKVWIRVFPDQPVTHKPAGAKMGSGKGDVEEHVVTVLPGRIIFELAGVPREVAYEAMRRAGHKLPFKTRFMEREERK